MIFSLHKCLCVCVSLCRCCLQAIKEIIGPSEDIPAPDMNTGAREMAWFFDEYSKYKGFSPGVVTGKVRWGGWCTGDCLVASRHVMHYARVRCEGWKWGIIERPLYVLCCSWCTCTAPCSSSYPPPCRLCPVRALVPAACCAVLQPVHAHASLGSEAATVLVVLLCSA